MSMRRRKRRSSRIFVTLLGCTLAFGAYATFSKIRGTPPADSSGVSPPAPKPVAVTPISNPAPIALPALNQKPLLPVTTTPGPQPTTRPAETPPLAAAAIVEAPRPAPTKVQAPPPAPPVSIDPLKEAQAKLDAGDALTARSILNDPFISGRLPEAQRAPAKDLLGRLADQLIFSRKVYPNDRWTYAYSVQSGDRMVKIAADNDVTWELLGRINGISDPKKLRAGQTLKIIRGPFHAVVSKRSFTMDIYLGSPGEAGALYVTSFPVGLGADGSTPTGKWLVEQNKKIKNPTYYSPRGEGVIYPDDPTNPLGEFWIALAGLEGQAVGKLSYGIHGTIEPDSIGKEASMGCIRLKDGDIDLVFELLLDGKSEVIVRD